MKPPNLWRFLAAALSTIPSLTAIPAIVALALTSVAGSAAAQERVFLTPISKYGCAKSEPKIIPKGDLTIPGTNTIRFQGGGGDYAAQGFVAKRVQLVVDLVGDIVVIAQLVPELKADPALGPINCFEIDIPISAATREIYFSAVLYESEALIPADNPIHRALARLPIGPQHLTYIARNGCDRSAPKILPQSELTIPGTNTIRFQGGGGDYPGLGINVAQNGLTIEEKGDLLIVRAKLVPQLVFGLISNCFEANIPISRSARELRFIADFYEQDGNMNTIGNIINTSQASLLLEPVTRPAPTLSFWALLVLALGAAWVGYRRLRAKRTNATHSSTSYALLALGLSLLAPPPGRRTKQAHRRA